MKKHYRSQGKRKSPDFGEGPRYKRDSARFEKERKAAIRKGKEIPGRSPWTPKKTSIAVFQYLMEMPRNSAHALNITYGNLRNRVEKCAKQYTENGKRSPPYAPNLGTFREGWKFNSRDLWFLQVHFSKGLDDYVYLAKCLGRQEESIREYIKELEASPFQKGFGFIPISIPELCRGDYERLLRLESESKKTEQSLSERTRIFNEGIEYIESLFAGDQK